MELSVEGKVLFSIFVLAFGVHSTVIGSLNILKGTQFKDFFSLIKDRVVGLLTKNYEPENDSKAVTKVLSVLYIWQGFLLILVGLLLFYSVFN